MLTELDLVFDLEIFSFCLTLLMLCSQSIKRMQRQKRNPGIFSTCCFSLHLDLFEFYFSKDDEHLIVIDAHANGKFVENFLNVVELEIKVFKEIQ